MCALKALESLDADSTRIITVDISKSRIRSAMENIREIFGPKSQDRVLFLHGDSTQVLPGQIGPSDLVFVDGSHEYAEAHADGLWALSSALRYVLFDDYNPTRWPQVVLACDELRKRNPGAWLLVHSDRLLYRPEQKGLVHARKHGMLLFDRRGDLAKRCRAFEQGHVRID